MTEEEKIERVARAIFLAASNSKTKGDYVEYARAAVTTMAKLDLAQTEVQQFTALASFAKVEEQEQRHWQHLAWRLRNGEEFKGLHPIAADELKQAAGVLDWLSRIQKEEGETMSNTYPGYDLDVATRASEGATAPIATDNNGWRPIAEAPKAGTRGA